jgi:hypothetical protein
VVGDVVVVVAGDADEGSVDVVAGWGSCLKGEGLRGRGMPWARRVVVHGRETGRWRRLGWSCCWTRVRQAGAGAGEASLARPVNDVKARLDAMFEPGKVGARCA